MFSGSDPYIRPTGPIRVGKVVDNLLPRERGTDSEREGEREGGRGAQC